MHDRSIFYNVLVAHEVVHSLKGKKTGRMGFIEAKLDMSKAYDRIEWKYVTCNLRAFGFSEKYVALIHQCLASVSFSLILIETRCDSFTSDRGIRQRDPLSLYIFILYAEGLVAWLRTQKLLGIFGFKVS